MERAGDPGALAVPPRELAGLADRGEADSEVLACESGRSQDGEQGVALAAAGPVGRADDRQRLGRRARRAVMTGLLPSPIKSLSQGRHRR